MPGPAFARALQTLQDLAAHLRFYVEALEHQDRSLCGLASSHQERPEQPAGRRLTGRQSGGQALRLPTPVPVLIGEQEWAEDSARGLLPSEPRQFVPDRPGSFPLLSAFPACTGTLSETARRPEARSMHTNVRDPAGHDASVRHANPQGSAPVPPGSPGRPADHCRTTCDHSVSVARGDAPVPPLFVEQEGVPMRPMGWHPAGAGMTLAAGWN